MKFEINTGWRSILANSLIYKLVQIVAGEERTKNLILNDFIIPAGMDCTVLDMGCGPGNIVRFLPDYVKYIGFDISDNYIKTAQEKYAHRESTTFLCGLVTDEHIKSSIKPESIQVAILHGVLHHVDDSVGQQLLQFAGRSLVPNGRLFVLEPVWFEGQSKIKKWIMSNDRGRNIKYFDDWTCYLKNSTQAWGECEVVVRSDLSKLYDLIICDVKKSI